VSRAATQPGPKWARVDFLEREPPALRQNPEIAFACPACGREALAFLDGMGSCPHCAAVTPVEVSEALRATRVVESCPACGNGLLYVQRDFNQKVGLAVVVVGAVLAPFTPFYASLFVAAAIDAGLYALLPDVTVCYRCQAHMRGFARNPAHHAFDLHLAEQYSTHDADPAPPTR
jgi:transcription elongation factor Elf1